MVKKILILCLVLISLFAFSGCSSFDKDKFKDNLNDYFDWFDDEFGDLGEETKDEKSEEESSINPGDSIMIMPLG